MKRNLFFVTASVLVLSSSAAFAADSNTVYLNQTGNDQQANITQSGNGNSVGAFNGNSGFLQENGTLSGANLLTVKQSGNSNSVGRDIQGKQSGAGNSAAIFQEGTGSDVELQQTGTSNGAVPSGWNWTNDPGVFNKITQDSSSNGSKVSVIQDGKNNVFSIKQGNTGNSTSVNQIGEWGMAYVRQGIGAAETDASTGNALPTGGNYNVASITQNSAGLNYAVAVQGGGNSNSLSISQSGNLQGANAWQNGNANVFSSIQTNVGNVVGLTGGIYGTDSPITQTGDNNTYINTQTGSSNSANGSQTGNFNQVFNTQSGGSETVRGTQVGTYNYVSNSQAGSSNLLDYKQTNTVSTAFNQIVNDQSTTAVSNTAYVVQDGNGLYSKGLQTGGSYNSANVSQTGQFSASYYTQDGSSNSIIVAQVGNYNVSNVSQIGAGNHANIQQKP
ncbi:curlin [Rhodopseudomonas palustris]|uniref:Curlin n=1 Tax=Rhodopseudomonas palustris (strain ATCC BAA-98 / CGA009) TaxID=258594 RepID=Q6NAU8_RHOPA|nr:curlin [Rhodopseudomonas palustris]OPF91640.1 curlin [Rhodopseudomonas palustris]PPQ44512.1 curlin [Rhodopseudomonas palustris]QQM02576.1 hypothetical protein I8G32_01107 [Rhodopseudomonas palustris]RJF60202.1 curlin [Rhodopseudomonas palustris]WAB78758.1 curlin [Rhodopseudomonas palustris]